jgi:hypothetical protein
VVGADLYFVLTNTDLDFVNLKLLSKDGVADPAKNKNDHKAYDDEAKSDPQVGREGD